MLARKCSENSSKVDRERRMNSKEFMCCAPIKSVAARTMSAQLDRALFRQTIGVVAVRTPAPKISRIVNLLHGNLLNVPKLRNVVADPQNTKSDKLQKSPKDCKLILLNQRIQRNTDDPQTLHGIAKELNQKLLHEAVELVDYQVELSYTHFTVDQVLAKLLPKQVQVPSSFECVGHIAHLNLREPHLPFKHLIGQVILDKNPHIQTVVNKTDSIETEYRTFPMEILAGKNDFNVTVHESRAVFGFNYAEVYWNSRLQHEHARIIGLFDPKRDVVCDMMAGVGPFAIPLARKGCVVYANDLNPQSYRYLLENIQRNKVAHKVTAWNLDGRTFVQTLLGQNKRFSQVLLNLPATAIDFLNVFVDGGFDDWSQDQLPWIHCYCFSSAPEKEYEQDVLERVEKVLRGKLDRSALSFQLIRDVAPRKVMMCISFRLTSQLAHTVSRPKLPSVPKRLKTDPQRAK